MPWPAAGGLRVSVRASSILAARATSTSTTAMMTARAGGGRRPSGVFQRTHGPLSSVPKTMAVVGGSQQCRCKHSQWMQRHLRDPYVRASKKDDLRSRAAFKLKEMQEKHKIIRLGDSVVDLGCAPGGWSEVAVGLAGAQPSSSSSSSSSASHPPSPSQQQQQGRQRTRPRREGRVVGIDLLPVHPLAGATLLQGDFTDPGARAELLEHLAFSVPVDGTTRESSSSDDQGRWVVVVRVDVVLSDMAPNFTGDSFVDHRRCLDLCYEVFDFADEVFAPPSSSSSSTAGAGAGGTVLCKFFKGRDEAAFLAHVRARYREVKLLKPKASRSESSETYVLARGHKGPRSQEEDASGR